MKTLDDAVSNQDLIDRRIIERKGISGGVTHAVKIGDRAEIHVYAEYFDQRARELGFINGYRWGVEYPTNGKKPDLPDDVVVCIENGSMRDSVDGWDWGLIGSFRMVDDRYKPQDTSYLDKPTAIGAGMVSSKDESVDHVVHTKTTDTTIEFETVKVDDEFAFTAQDDSDWWDWQNDKMLRLPPVGERVSYSCVERDSKEAIEVGQWYCGTIIAYHCGYVWTSDNGIRALSNTRFRPLDRATRKAEAEKKRVVKSAMKSVAEISCLEPRAMQVKTIQELYDRGYLRLPTEKNAKYNEGEAN